MERDLEVNRRARNCLYTVTFLGALFRENEVLICMEVMEKSLYDYYTDAHKFNLGMPEPTLGKYYSKFCLLIRKISLSSSIYFRGNRLCSAEGTEISKR